MNSREQMAELERRVCESLGLEPKDTLAVSLHFAGGELLTADIKQIVRLDKAAKVVQLIEDAGDSVKESVR